LLTNKRKIFFGWSRSVRVYLNLKFFGHLIEYLILRAKRSENMRLRKRERERERVRERER